MSRQKILVMIYFIVKIKNIYLEMIRKMRTVKTNER